MSDKENHSEYMPVNISCFFRGLRWSLQPLGEKIIIHSTTKVNNFTLAHRNVTKLGKRDVKRSEEKHCKSEAVCEAEHVVLEEEDMTDWERQ